MSDAVAPGDHRRATSRPLAREAGRQLPEEPVLRVPLRPSFSWHRRK